MKDLAKRFRFPVLFFACFLLLASPYASPYVPPHAASAAIVADGDDHIRPAIQPERGAPSAPSAGSVGSAVPASAKVLVYFSPKGGAQEAIIREIDAAKVSIRMQAYNYSSEPIGAALLKANQRGVKITALLDDSNQTAQYTGATFLQNQGAQVFTDGKHKIAHSKIMILDGNTPNGTIITGSFNFTKAAEESNAENLLVIKDSLELVTAYNANFDAHMTHATPYERKGATTLPMPEDDDETTTLPPITTTTPPITLPTTPPVVVTSGKTNINTATAKELEKLPNIGKVTAARIIEYRQAKGPFKSVQDLDKVQGIGKATLEKLRDLVTVG